MKALIIKIVKALVDQPEEVSVNEVGGTHTKVLEIRAAKADLGKIIGKQGRTTHIIRIFLNAVAGKTRDKYILEIVE